MPVARSEITPNGDTLQQRTILLSFYAAKRSPRSLGFQPIISQRPAEKDAFTTAVAAWSRTSKDTNRMFYFLRVYDRIDVWAARTLSGVKKFLSICNL